VDDLFEPPQLVAFDARVCPFPHVKGVEAPTLSKGHEMLRGRQFGPGENLWKEGVGYRAVFSPSGDPDLDRFQAEAAALQMAATLNAFDAEDCVRA
jgi:hypothetical protein